MRKLRLKFILATGNKRRLVIAYAKMVPPFNLYKDAEFIHTEEGQFHRADVMGPIDEVWIDLENTVDRMLDFPPPRSQD